MSPINQWAPSKFSDIFGRKNEPTVRRIQALVKTRTPFAGALIGPMGVCKTQLARLLAKGCVCSNPDLESGDPCNVCTPCLDADPAHSGAIHRMQFSWINAEIQTDRHRISELLTELQAGYCPPLLIVDELQRFSETRFQEVFLNFITDLREGVFACTVMTGSNLKGRSMTGVLPELLDRLKVFPLHRPAPDEVAGFLLQQLNQWGIRSTPAVIADLVACSNGSLRNCLNTLEEARVGNDGLLDIPFIRDVLPLAAQEEVYRNPFND